MTDEQFDFLNIKLSAIIILLSLLLGAVVAGLLIYMLDFKDMMALLVKGK